MRTFEVVYRALAAPADRHVTVGVEAFGDGYLVRFAPGRAPAEFFQRRSVAAGPEPVEMREAVLRTLRGFGSVKLCREAGELDAPGDPSTLSEAVRAGIDYADALRVGDDFDGLAPAGRNLGYKGETLRVFVAAAAHLISRYQGFTLAPRGPSQCIAALER